MARTNQKHGRFGLPPKIGLMPDAALLESGMRQVRELLAGDHSKSAVEIAKDLHKRYATPDSESLLVEAYQARIRDLLKQGLTLEAKSLLNLVCSRFPGARNQIDQIAWDVRASANDLAELVAPLGDPKLTNELREKIEGAIRQRVDDLGALSQASSLPPAHPLRVAAKALDEAFRAVTCGAVDDDTLRLPQVSYRSPLAPWKALIQAIAMFYRGEHDASRKRLASIAPDSVPARLIAPMQALLGQAHGAATTTAAMNLIRAVASSEKILHAAFAAFEDAVGSQDQKQVLDRAREAIGLCRQFCPELVDKLRQHILVRLMLLGVYADRSQAAAGKAKEDAYWLRLLARGIEEKATSGEGRYRAVQFWESFREQALREKWFAAHSLEDGLLSLRMALIVSRLHWETIEYLQDEETTQPHLLDAGYLFSRGCLADPHPEAFAEWLAWAKRENQNPDQVAESWRKARDQDVTPLLWLVESAERRGAYQKSIKFLEQAEQLDKLNPQVRKARIRLLVAAVLRHLRQRKPHLAVQGIERLAALSESLSPVVLALRCVCCACDGDTAGMAANRSALEAQVGESGLVLLAGVLEASGFSLAEAGFQAKTRTFAEAGALAGLARACAAGELPGLRCVIPGPWEAGVRAALDRPAHGLDAARLLAIAEAALRSDLSRLAFQVSAVGLRAGGADARFLFLRGRALPHWEQERSLACLQAALQWAQRDRDMELAGKVLDRLQGHPAVGPEEESEGFQIPAERLQAIVEEERANDSYPQQRKRRRERQQMDAYEEKEAIGELAAMLRDGAPEVRKRILKAMRRGDRTEDIVHRFRAHALARQAAEAPQARLPKQPQPEQGSLF